MDSLGCSSFQQASRQMVHTNCYWCCGLDAARARRFPSFLLGCRCACTLALGNSTPPIHVVQVSDLEFFLVRGLENQYQDWKKSWFKLFNFGGNILLDVKRKKLIYRLNYFVFSATDLQTSSCCKTIKKDKSLDVFFSLFQILGRGLQLSPERESI